MECRALLRLQTSVPSSCRVLNHRWMRRPARQRSASVKLLRHQMRPMWFNAALRLRPNFWHWGNWMDFVHRKSKDLECFKARQLGLRRKFWTTQMRRNEQQTTHNKSCVTVLFEILKVKKVTLAGQWTPLRRSTCSFLCWLQVLENMR